MNILLHACASSLSLAEIEMSHVHSKSSGGRSGLELILHGQATQGSDEVCSPNPTGVVLCGCVNPLLPVMRGTGESVEVCIHLASASQINLH